MALKFALGKKAVFFTFVACIFLSLLIFSTSIGKNYDMRQKIFVIETRVDTMNMFVSDVEKDVERAAYIAGFRSLVALVDHIIAEGEYLDDVDASFNEAFFNGTIEGVSSSLLANNTFNYWMDKIESEANEINLILNFSINNIDIYQDDPWKVRIDVNLRIDISDNEGISSWTREKSITSYLELAGFEDPIYVLGTNGIFENRIEQTIHDSFVTGSNVDNLLNHTYEGYYTNFTGAPSFLMRLEGDFGESEYGIESLVDIDELVSKGVSAKSKTIVDYIYFDNLNNPTSYHVSGAPSWFKIDGVVDQSGNFTHIDLYEVGSLT